MSADESDSDLEVFNNLLPPDQDRTAIDEKRTLLGLQAPIPSVPGSPVAASGPGPLGPASGTASNALDASLAAALASKEPAQAAPPGSPTTRQAVNLDEWATSRPATTGQPAAAQSSKRPRAAAKAAGDSAAASLADADAGWEDDDDKTTIYGTGDESGTQDLLRPVVAPAAQPPPPMSRPPGAMLPPTPAQRRRPQANQDTAFIPVATPSRPSWLPYTIALALIALVVSVGFLLRPPSEGSLHVTVTGPGNRAIPGVEVLINGKLRCTASPCEVPGLTADTYLVVARAPGYQPTGEIAVDVSGAQSVKNITLARFVGTGIQVLGKGSGLTLTVDDQELGPLPQSLRDMAPGEHVIQVSGGERYADFTQRVVVESGRMTTVGPIRLRVLRGLATIVPGPGAEGADATLLVGSTRKVLPALPIKLEVDTRQSHVLVAKREGYLSFQQPIVFSDGQAERTIEIAMQRKPARGERTQARGEQTSPAAKSQTSTLNLISTPPSSVVLDGQPLGSTPQKALRVEPGNHNVLFINGSERQHLQVEVARGEQETVAVHF